MTSESTPPPPTNGGGLKYGIIGLVLLAGAVGLWFAVRPGKEAPPPKPPPKVEEPKRSTALAPSDLVIPETKPDAGAPPAEKPASRKARRSGVCDGEIDRAKALAVVNSNRRQVRQCYERRLKMNNILQGTVNVELRIAANGSVENVTLSGTLKDNDVYSCIRHVASTWKFPPPTQGRCAIVAVPFNLTPQTE